MLYLQEDMVCLSCTATGERVCLAAEGFGNRHCFLENIADKVRIEHDNISLTWGKNIIHYGSDEVKIWHSNWVD